MSQSEGNLETLKITADKLSTENSNTPLEIEISTQAKRSFDEEFSYLIVDEDILDLSKLDMDDEETWLFNPRTGTGHYEYGDKRHTGPTIQSWLQQSEDLELTEQSIQLWLEKPDDLSSNQDLDVSSASSYVTSRGEFDDDDDFHVQTQSEHHLLTYQQRPLGKYNCNDDTRTRVIPFSKYWPTSSSNTCDGPLGVQEHERKEYQIYLANATVEWFKNRRSDPERKSRRHRGRSDGYVPILEGDLYQPPGLLSEADSDELLNPSISEIRRVRDAFLNRPNRFDPRLDQTELQDVCPLDQTESQDICPHDQSELQDTCPIDQSQFQCKPSRDKNPHQPTTNCSILDSTFATHSEQDHPLITLPSSTEACATEREQSLASLRERLEKLRLKQYRDS